MPEAAIVAGDNWYAVAAAAVAIYAVGFLLYGALFSKLWMSLAGYTPEQLKPHGWKMALGWIMPVLTAIGLERFVTLLNRIGIPIRAEV
jgi:hypothetical protein